MKPRRFPITDLKDWTGSMCRISTYPPRCLLILLSFAGLLHFDSSPLPLLWAQEIYDSQKETIPKMTPAEAVRTAKLPEGFKITAVASEPNVQQPIAMAWDPLGRLLIAENYTYAESALRVDHALSDRIVILEDADKDGVFENRKVFAEGLQGLTSIEFGGPNKRGVWALAPPHLLFIPDHDGDGVADTKPQVVVRGFNAQIRHNFANGLRFGPDGWLYGRHGILGASEVSIPTAITIPRPPGYVAPTHKLTCGIWRFHPIEERIEMVCEGTTNPWGMDWDEHGNLFFINTVIGHLWHAIPNSHLERMYGEDSDPYAYELIPQVADHVHWDSSAEDWRETRKGPPSNGTDLAGGGHAHSGLMIYQADQWPEEYRGNVFALNLHGRRINRDFLHPNGSGFKASHGPDMVFWQDPWFRGLDISQAPDGSAMVIDWSDIGECHDDDGVHRTSGRVYRISYQNSQQLPYQEPLSILRRIYSKRDQVIAFNPSEAWLSSQEVVSIISHPNVWFTQQLIKQLTPGAPIENDKKLLDLVTKAPPDFNDPKTRFAVTTQLRGLWVLNACKRLDVDTLLSILRSKQHASVHMWACKLLLDTLYPDDDAPGLFGRSQKLAGRSEDPRRREIEFEILDCLYAQSKPHAPAPLRLLLASQLPKFSDKFEPLLQMLLRSDDLSDDLTFSLVLWYGLKDRVPEQLLETVKLLQNTKLHKVQELVLRRIASITLQNAKDSDLASRALSSFLADAIQKDNPKLHAACIRGLWGAYQGRSQISKPAHWNELANLAAKHPDPGIQRLAVLLSSMFDGAVDPKPLMQIVLDKSISIPERKVAVEAVGGIDQEHAIEGLKGLFSDADLGNAAAFALRRSLTKPRAQELIDLFEKSPEATRRGIVSALGSRVDTMEVLLDALENKKIPKDSVDATTWRQFLSASNWQLLERARRFTKVLDPPENRKELIEKHEALLNPEFIAKANANSGRAIWISKCGNCHKLYGEGGQIGPELTGAQRSNLRYWLENILAPSTVLAENYRTTAIRTLDGRVITGVVVAQTPMELTIQTAQEKLVLAVADIEERVPSELSLMPEGLLEDLDDEKKANLLKYLMSSPQELSK